MPSVADWLTYLETETEIRLLHLDGTEPTRRSSRRPGRSGQTAGTSGSGPGVFFHQPIELAPDASLAPPSQAQQ
ncbi:hypothetical protein [Nitriliruptor alkaliphilus]|uniref:hypothetical protein n=1 Tax=Nitriliruptor alkaliphilus TaxID=427918 RepID=UPI0006989ABC|nr:hypothetical protein [Nitriliruptor alkaliphilus]